MKKSQVSSGSHVPIIPTTSAFAVCLCTLAFDVCSFYGFSTEWQLIEIMPIFSVPMLHTGEMVL